MTIVPCSQGEHHYDNEQHDSCPFCRSVDAIGIPDTEGVRLPPIGSGNNGPGAGNYVPETEKLDRSNTPSRSSEGPETHQKRPNLSSPTIAGPLRGKSADTPDQRESNDNDTEDSSAGFNPVVGWLVVTSHDNRGRDFRIRSGWNSLGRDADNKICIDFDQGVSRKIHAHIVYDHETNEFFVKHNLGTQGTRLNGRMVGDLTPLQAGDLIRVGQTEFTFAPLCNEKFNWFGTQHANAAATQQQDSGAKP